MARFEIGLDVGMAVHDHVAIDHMAATVNDLRVKPMIMESGSKKIGRECSAYTAHTVATNMGLEFSVENGDGDSSS